MRGPLRDGAAGGWRDPGPEVRALLRLKVLPGLGDRTVLRLVEAFGGAVPALAASPREFRSVGGSEAERARGDRTLGRVAEVALERAEALDVRVVGLGGEGYPAMLRALHDPPPVVFLRGRVDVLERPVVAVVGSRKATGYGRRTAEIVGGALGRAEVTVASGLALGVDAAAHRGALRVGGSLLGVLGSGVDVPYPRSNSALFDRLVRDHLLISEFLPGTGAAPHHFPRRNRILAALSLAVIVVEAAERSGALITVDHALDLGREVLAVPGRVDSPTSAGTNALIGDGAGMVDDPREVVPTLDAALPAFAGWRSRRSPAPGKGVAGPPSGVSGEAGRIWDALEDGPRSVDDLSRALGLPTERVLGLLSGLEVAGWAEMRPGMVFARSPRGGAMVD